MLKIYIGIDPGQRSGGIAWIEVVDYINNDGTVPQWRTRTLVKAVKLQGMTERDIWDLISSLANRADEIYCVLEKVHAMPRQGVASTFGFGRNRGHLEMALTAAGVVWKEETPAKWQKRMGCLTKGDKNVSKRKAQHLFPEQKVILSTADALLIALNCKDHWEEIK